MTVASPEPRGWPRRRWLLFILAVFGAQLGLIFCLSDPPPLPPRLPPQAAAIHFVPGSASDLRALEDPTLFALPHREGFSGLAWLQAPPPPFRGFAWSEEPNWLQLSADRLGTIFDPLIEPDDPNAPPTLSRPEPKLTLTQVPAPEPGPSQSWLRLEGDLARRRLITPVELPSQPARDLLANTVVQVAVDDAGRVASVPVLLPPGSGDREVDNEAIKRAMNSRFESVPALEPAGGSRSLPHLTWGRMVFEWHTVPALPTPVPPAGP